MIIFKASVLVLGMLVTPSFAAAQEPFIELMRADLRADKVAILTESMVFSEAEADVFWPVYREYELAWIPTEPFGPNIRVSAVA